MSTNAVIHGAVRRDLDRFVEALDSFRVGDRPRAAELRTAWTNFREQLHDHHTGEHEIAWPALERVGVSRDLLATMDEEHDAMASALAAADEALAVLVRTPDMATATRAQAAVVRLREVTTTHLDHEEAEIEPVYLAHHDHPAIVGMTQEFRRQGSAAWSGRFLAWLLDGATPQQRAALDRTVPKPVRAVLVGIFGRGYRRTVAPVWTR